MIEMERRIKLMTLAIEVDEAYERAASSKCTCGSDPEGACSFCSRWERADKKLSEFKALVERGLGMD